jgi:tetratricopeptide (TPR) repeat protein
VTPEDRVAARRALEERKLSIEQVEAILASCAKSGRSFEGEAALRGWLGRPDAPPRPEGSARPAEPRRALPAWFFPALLGLAFLIFSGLLLASLSSLRERSQRDEELQEETARSRVEAERLSRLARADYERKSLEERHRQAAEALGQARLALAQAEARAPVPGDPERRRLLVEATLGFTKYLDDRPDDPQARIDRSRAYELRGNFDKAVEDLEFALALRKDLEPAHRDRLAQLRRLTRRSP